MSDSTTETPSKVAIGISFGNSYSSIAYTTSEGKSEVIANEEGDRQIPSILSYIDGEEFQGTQAKAQLIRNPKNTVAFWRDYIGQDFKAIDPTPSHQSAHPIQYEGTVAFSIVDGKDDANNNVTVSEITTRHLKKLVISASDYIGKKVTSAVITVPTNFNKHQKDALVESAKNANLEILQIINEPIASLLAHDAKFLSKPKDKIVLVVDIGGIRSDISVIASREGIYTILSTKHDYEISGSTFDKVLIDYFSKEFLKKHKNAKDPRENQKSLSKLTLESESVKKALSLGLNASFSVESLIDGIDFTCTVNRTRYELLSNKVFDSVVRLCLSVIEKAELKPFDIDDILLSGGVSHTPKISSILKTNFPDHVDIISTSTKSDAINPSELNSRGAAIQASLISEFELEDIKNSTDPIVTITPHLLNSIGIEGKNGFIPIIEKFTPIPTRRNYDFIIKDDDDYNEDVLIKLVEGISKIETKQVEKSIKEKDVNGKKDDDDEDDDEDDESEEDEDEEIQEKVWTIGKTLAEASIKGIKKNGKVEVQINVGSDNSITLIAKEHGSKTGIRGIVSA